MNFLSFLASLCKCKNVTHSKMFYTFLDISNHVNKSTSQGEIIFFLEGSNLSHNSQNPNCHHHEQSRKSCIYLCLPGTPIISRFETHTASWNLKHLFRHNFFSISGSIHCFKVFIKMRLENTKHVTKAVFLLWRIFSLSISHAEIWRKLLSEGHKCSHLADCTASGKKWHGYKSANSAVCACYTVIKNMLVHLLHFLLSLSSSHFLPL